METFCMYTMRAASALTLVIVRWIPTENTGAFKLYYKDHLHGDKPRLANGIGDRGQLVCIIARGVIERYAALRHVTIVHR